MNYEKNDYFKILKTWCDTLIKLQMKEPQSPAIYGGIFCPACGRIHGRINDCMYPLIYLYKKTGDKKYYEAAKDVYCWTKHNTHRPGGFFLNDPNCLWFATTVFFNIQLGELLYHCKDVICPIEWEEWNASYCETLDFIYKNFNENLSCNINYRIAAAAAMAVAWAVKGEEKYKQRARELALYAINHIGEDGLIFGETQGLDSYGIAPRGCRGVDLGYNVEESLPNLAVYLKYIGEDRTVEQALLRSMDAHLSFMLPDGAWDNSWGSRSAKWTYYGSRTSDGCQGAYAYLSDRNALYAEAAHRNFLLYKKSTHNGLLTGGPHYADARLPTCIHHTFCHAKSLIPLIESKMKRDKDLLLPRETSKGMKTFSSVNVTLAAKGHFKASFSCYDFNALNASTTPTGGALTMLWNDKAGVILAASINEYDLVENLNMQVPPYFNDICQTPRLELKRGKEVFRNTLDTTANITASEDKTTLVYNAQGVLKNFLLHGTERFQITYKLGDSIFEICAATTAEDAVYILPLIARNTEALTVCGPAAQLKRENAVITITCSQPITHDTSIGKRIFHPCGGFLSAHLRVPIPKNQQVTLKIKVQ